MGTFRKLDRRNYPAATVILARISQMLLALIIAATAVVAIICSCTMFVYYLRRTNTSAVWQLLQLGLKVKK
jgi:hypothetical protein